MRADCARGLGASGLCPFSDIQPASSGRSGQPVGQRRPKEPQDASDTRSAGSIADARLHGFDIEELGPIGVQDARTKPRAIFRCRAARRRRASVADPLASPPSESSIAHPAASRAKLTSSSRSLPLSFFLPPRPKKLDMRLFLTVFWDPEVSIELKLMTRSPMPM